MTNKCRPCHKGIVHSWKKSQHALAQTNLTQEDKSSFNMAGIRIYNNDASSLVTLSKDFIFTTEINNYTQEFQAIRKIGVSPLIQYLIPTDKGHIQVNQMAFNPSKKEWFNIFGQEKRTPEDWGHWLGKGMNWNSQCAYCHNTGVVKNYDNQKSYLTTYKQQGVTCNACHNITEKHFNRPSKQYIKENSNAITYLNTHSSNNKVSVIDTCATCHSRRVQLTESFKPGDKFLNHFAPVIPDESNDYYPDGQVFTENYEVISFMGSKMYNKGVRCTNCHDVHSGKLRKTGDALCLECHDTGKKKPIKRHDFHDKKISCVNCHMPKTNYMSIDARRDHAFTIPDPLLTKLYKIPNACNRCHVNRSTEWSLSKVQNWYGGKMQRSTRKRAINFARARQILPNAHLPLLDLLNTGLNSDDNALWEAVSVALLKNYLFDSRVKKTLTERLTDKNDFIRLQAVRTLDSYLETIPGLAIKLLKDKVLAVRLQSAWAFRKSLNKKDKVYKELVKYLQFNSDQPVGNMQLGSFYLAREEIDKAIKYFLRGLSMDKNSDVLHGALAMAYSKNKNQNKVIEHLQLAIKLLPGNAEYHFNLGLVYAQINQLEFAISSFKKALKINGDFYKAWLNLGLARLKTGKLLEAKKALKKALKINDFNNVNNADERILYGLSKINTMQGKYKLAFTQIKKLINKNPGNPDYQSLMKEIVFRMNKL